MIVEVLLWISAILAVTQIFLAIVDAFEIVPILRLKPLEPQKPLSVQNPFVSFHVPICSEPPEVVIETLKCLASIEYDRYEVLVVDNNTEDEALWRPVKLYCAELGNRFKFFHERYVAGFKAGALCFALEHSSPSAEIIGIIDSDYRVLPGHGKAAAAYFVDDDVAFVQYPQAYLPDANNILSIAMDVEFGQVFESSMMVRNSWNAILLHGTMCFIRKSHLQQVGGWQGWCLTEDSELGLRLLSAGMKGIYINELSGFGMMPLIYHDFKKQRHRWVVGGAQQCRRYLPAFILNDSGTCGLDWTQKGLFLQFWSRWMREAVLVILFPFSCIVVLLDVSGAANCNGSLLCFVMIMTLALSTSKSILISRFIMRRAWHASFLACLLSISLTFTIGRAWLVGLFLGEQTFHRTPKKKSSRLSMSILLPQETSLAFVSGLMAFLCVSCSRPSSVFLIVVMLGYLFVFSSGMIFSFLN